MPKNILLVQTGSRVARATRRALLEGDQGPFRVEWSRTQAAALEHLARVQNHEDNLYDRIDAVLVDLFLTDSRGIGTFERLFAAAPQTPILILALSRHEATARLGVQRGAKDYLLKDRMDDYWLPKLVRHMIEWAVTADELRGEKERAQVVLNSIGDAVLATDEHCVVSYLNAAAENLTGWPLAEAVGRPVKEVFRIVDSGSGEATVNPMTQAVREKKAVSLPPNALLIRRDGFESAIEDSRAPIHDAQGRLTGAVTVFRDVSVARALSVRMSHLAEHDGLTDLPNRTLFDDRLGQAMVMCRRQGTQLALLYLDIDGFKQINDSSGHAIGDRLLRSIAARLSTCVRSSDTVSRQGGDEFVILLCEIAHARDAAIAADKIIAVLSESYQIDQLFFNVSASIGIATFPEDATTADSLLENADTAMYWAKDCGGNNYRFFKSEMHLRALSTRLNHS